MVMRAREVVLRFQSSFRGFLLKVCYFLVPKKLMDVFDFQSSFRGFLLKVDFVHERREEFKDFVFQSSFRGFLLKENNVDLFSLIEEYAPESFNPLLEDFS